MVHAFPNHPGDHASADQPRWLIRRLVPDDRTLLRPLRLEALQSHPEAFGGSFEEEQVEDTGRLIAEPPGATLGAFVADQLVGCVGLLVSSRIKRRHMGHVVNFFVRPMWRGTGLARALLTELIQYAEAVRLRKLTLSVTVGNEPARRLYLHAGFRTYGTDTGSLLIGADMYDEELMALTMAKAGADSQVTGSA